MQSNHSETIACEIHPAPSDAGVLDLFHRQVRLAPGAVAVVSESETLTYGELSARVDRLALELRERGLGPGGLAGLMVDRSAAMVVGVLGILRAGGAWVPLDPALPPGRLSDMLEDADPWVLVTQKCFGPLVTRPAGSIVWLDEDGDRRLEGALAAPASTDLAYVIFTSGTTGRPKGVQISHGALMNLIRSVQREPGFSEHDAMLAVTTLSFDISVLELLLPLCSGGRVILAEREAALDPTRLTALLDQHRVTVMQATPATWRMLIGAGWKGRAELRVFCGGEALTRELADGLLARCQALWNMYGPTETTIYSAVHRVTAGTDVPIGHAVANTGLRVLDERLQPVPPGQVGELYIAGAGLARGYLKRPDLTAEKFVPDPFQAGRMYRTGDLARRLPSGDLVCLGRIDSQVKIRGHRIELEEVESVLRSAAGVREAVVLAVDAGGPDKQLVAGVVLEPGHRLDVPRLRRQLARKLPGPMVPDAFVVLASIPTTPNGKTDRSRVAGLLTRAPSGPIAPRTVAGPAPLSYGQESHWLLDRMSPGLTAYHIPQLFRLAGEPCVETLRRSLDLIVARHDALRTTYWLEDGEPFQRVQESAAVPLLTVSRDTLESAFELLAGELARPFDLQRDCMLRATLIRLGPADSLLMLVTHHIASDGWSQRILLRELTAAYEGRDPGALPAVRYGDYACWQRDRMRDPARLADLAWWRQTLDGIPAGSAPRSAGQRGAHDSLDLPAALVGGLRAMGRSQQTTLFTVLLAGLDVLLMRLTGEDDVVVGVPAANRTQPETSEMMGVFMNVLVHRTSLAGDPSFRELVGRVRRTCREAHAHGELPFELVVRELQPQHGLFQVMFVVDMADTGAFELGALRGTVLSIEQPVSMFGLSLRLSAGPTGMRVTAEYRTDLFDAPVIRRLLDDYQSILERMVGDVDAPIGTVERRSPDEGAPAELPRTPRHEAFPELVAALAPVWQEVLGVEPIGPEESFFDLGGHSLLAVQLFSRVHETLGARVSLADWSLAPTLDGMAALIGRGPAGAPARAAQLRPAAEGPGSLVSLQSRGDGTPFFWVHGLNGSHFTDLVRHAGTAQPWYGFQAAGLGDGEAPFDSILEMARCYVEALRRVQPAGPYFLGGYCFGGLVALSMACLLSAAGQTVAGLIIVELAAVNLRTTVQDSPWHSLRRAVSTLPQLVASSPQRLLRGIGPRLRRMRRYLSSTGDADVLDELEGSSTWTEEQRRVARAHHAATLEHVVLPYDGRVTLIRGSEAPWRWDDDDPSLGWSRIARSGVDLHWIPGARHTDIVHDPHARRTADTLCTILDQGCETVARRRSTHEA